MKGGLIYRRRFGMHTGDFLGRLRSSEPRDWKNFFELQPRFTTKQSNSRLGSMKPNTALAQAYYAKKQGLKLAISETGAGQWGSALAMSCSLFALKARIYMVRVSAQQKPGRKILMETYGTEVLESPSQNTKIGRKLLAENN